MKIDDYLTHIDHKEDLPFLRSKLFDVNMRLFHSSPNYKRIIRYCCEHIADMATAHFDDYKKPHGMSGANAGIPFNIIGIVRNRGEKDEYCQIMINPKLKAGYKKKELVSSNCGSIRLKEPIKIWRYIEIFVEYYDTEGKHHEEMFIRRTGALTIQHEIDHNLGILITDKQ